MAGAVGAGQAMSGCHGREIGDFGGDLVEMDEGWRVPAGGFQHVLKIAAVLAAGGEGLTRGRRRAGTGIERVEPAQEMVRLIRKGAHVGGADVEQMAAIVGAVGKSRAEAASPVEQQDAGGVMTVAE
jgi:hypothetical protein